jgi:hypothetical protein
MLALLALTLALATPPDAATPAPSATPSALSAPESAQTPLRRGFPHEPRRLPNEPALAPGDALIHNTGSTNFAGYAIVVHPDASAEVVVDGEGAQHKAVGAAQARWLFVKLREANPLDTMPIERCMKSASFGSSTFITYGGQETPDLSCGGGATARELMRTVSVILNQLGVDLRHSRRRFIQ